MIDRILSLLEESKMTAKQLTEQLEISPSSVSEWKKGKMKPTIDVLIRISLIFHVSLDWLLTGECEKHKTKPLISNINENEGELIKDYRVLRYEKQIEILTRTKVYAEQQRALNEAAKASERKKKLETLREFKILDLEQVQVETKVFELPASAGPGEYIDGESPYDMVTYDKNDVPAGADFGIRITGDSMEPLIHDGDIVWIKKQPTVDNNDVGIFIVDNEAFCKKLELDHKTKTVRLISLNQVYKPMIIDENRSFTIVGKVIL